MKPTIQEIDAIKAKYPALKKRWGTVIYYMRELDDNPLLKDGPWDSDGTSGIDCELVRFSRDYVMNYYREIITLFKGDIGMKDPLLVQLPKVVRTYLIEEASCLKPQ